MGVTNFPQAPAVDDEPPTVQVVGFDIFIKLLCTKCGSGDVLICNGRAHEAVCVHCHTAYRVTFLHFDPDDPNPDSRDEHGKPKTALMMRGRQISGILLPRVPTLPT